MVTLGSDCHKRMHTLVAVDDNGLQLATRTVPATAQGHLQALQWARGWPQRRWGLEDCRHVSRRLEADLLGAGESVVRVPPKLMAGARHSGRAAGKSDPIDALAVARAVLREPALPIARLEGQSRALKLLVDHREDLLGERTRIQNRLRWYLHELEPEHQLKPGALSHLNVLDRLHEWLVSQRGLVAELARELVELIRQLTLRINQLERELQRLTARLAPSLLELDGCAALTAAKLLAETADITRFWGRAAYAMHNGTAPIPASSGNRTRHRLNRGGNRQLNTALHRIAITQLRLGGAGAAYVQRLTAAGKTKTEAIRGLRRRLSDEVYRRLLADHHASAGAQAAAA